MFASAVIAANAIAGALYADMVYGCSSLKQTPIPKFPRSDAKKDYIMLRRYEARRQIKQAHRIRVIAWAIFTPIGICLLIKVLSLAIQLVLL